MSLTPAELEALRLSLLVATVGTAASLLPALGIAWVLARYRFPGKILLDGLIHLPLVLPPVVIGYILLVGLGRRGVIGAWLYESFGVTFAFTWKGAAIVAAVMGFPLLVRALRLSIETLDDGLVGAARTLGAGPFRAFMTVTLPLITPGLLTGAILAFARALGEFGATIAFVGNIPGQTQTLPLALYSALQLPGGEEAAWRIVLISTLFAVALLGLSELSNRFLTRRLTGTRP